MAEMFDGKGDGASGLVERGEGVTSVMKLAAWGT